MTEKYRELDTDIINDEGSVNLASPQTTLDKSPVKSALSEKNKSKLKTMDLPRIERAVREILQAVGEDPDREGLLETPARVARMYEEIFAGLHKNPLDVMKVFNEPNHDGMVLISDIPFYSMCEHHLLPFVGKAHVVYIPKDGRILGLSKIARLVDIISKKPQVQERLTSQVADFMVKALQPQGVAVIVQAEHLCMTMRGIRKPGSITITSALRGLCKTDARTRSEAMSLIKLGENH
ncbi:MAG: GTP cyclohydrolase I FolE [Clostridiales bacterium]|nr:GTP cyclohydrolase I FolE [Clostridiales bacterium]